MDKVNVSPPGSLSPERRRKTCLPDCGLYQSALSRVLGDAPPFAPFAQRLRVWWRNARSHNPPRQDVHVKEKK
jgi:hypothetical protein